MLPDRASGKTSAEAAECPLRIAIHVQHLLGVGHTVRAAAIARAVAAGGHDVLLLTGGMPVPGLDSGNARVVQLPPIAARADGSWALETAPGTPVTDLDWARRRNVLGEAIRHFDPDIFLVEHFPFGRRAFRGEIGAAIAEARADGGETLIVSSVRDIVQPPKSADRARDILALIDQRFDAVLVHGDPALAPFDTGFADAARIGGKLTYTGYIDAGAAPSITSERQGVLVSAGGGRVGSALLTAAADARALSALADAPWTFIVGAGADGETRDHVRARMRPQDELLDHATDFRARMARAALSISQAGYNTVVDMLATGTPAMLVPYAEHGEKEQSLRAASLEKAGLARAIHLPASAVDVATAIDTAPILPAGRSRPRLNGLAKTVTALESLAAKRRMASA